MRLWRTGADDLVFSSKEDGDLDVSILQLCLILLLTCMHACMQA